MLQSTDFINDCEYVDFIENNIYNYCVVVENNVLKGTCKVRLDAKGDLAPMEFHRDQLKVLGKANKTHGKNLDESNEEEICD